MPSTEGTALTIVSLVPLTAPEADRIRAIDPTLELIEAGGWFDGELARSWPEATARRYIHGQGQGTRAERDALLARADVVIGGFPFPLDLRARAPRMRWFHQSPAGVSNLRVGDLWASDVLVTSSRGFGETRAIAEYALAGMLYFAKGFDQAARDARGGAFDHPRYSIGAMAEKTVCVIGAGGIGRQVAELCHALGMRVTGTRRHTERDESDRPFERIEPPERLHELLAESQFVAVCCQWTEQTTGLLDSQAFACMRPGTILVNVARGEIVDESALLVALENGTLGGAVLDVYVGEFEHTPPAALWSHPKVLVTPHTSAMSDRRRRRFVDCFCENLRAWLRNEPMINTVDWHQGY
ncbi:MAG: D-2-hydroxyacid dehydrogenase [Gammaproteobacteria bacterium]|nr:D-2-hydroxyacid dehydrogenase [Gammaproteobacteria bacterium]